MRTSVTGRDRRLLLIAATIIPVTCNRVIGINQDVADLGSSVVWKKRCAISLVRERFGESG